MRCFLAGLLLLAGLNDAAREVARQVAAAVREPAAWIFRNVSALDEAMATEARQALETELRAQGVRLAEPPAAYEIRITLSENAARYLMVAEVRHGGERQVFLSGWPKSAAGATAPPEPAVSLQKKLLWRQAQPVLDARPAGGALLILAPGQVTRAAGNASQTLLVATSRPALRDPRGRLAVNGNAFQVSLPGTICRGVVEPFSMQCQDSEEPWALDSAGRLLALANYAPGRNYFGGRIFTAPGGPRDLPPFYTAAAVDQRGQRLWIFTGLDGRAHVFTEAWEPAPAVELWGSGVAGVETPCGPFVLVSRPGDAADSDAVQAWAPHGRSFVPAGAAAEFDGPVTALWSTGAAGALAVTREHNSGDYAAYSLAVACGS